MSTPIYNGRSTPPTGYMLSDTYRTSTRTDYPDSTFDGASLTYDTVASTAYRTYNEETADYRPVLLIIDW